MSLLRPRRLAARIYAATGVLIALQVGGTVLGFLAWGEVQRASARQEELTAQRDVVEGLGRACREAYVHEAHALIEGPGHLAHLGGVQADVDARLVEVRRLQLPEGADIDAVQRAIAASNAWFGVEVVPVVRAGAPPHDTAVALHAETERRASAEEAAIGAVLAVLDAAGAAERARVTDATARAWIGVGLLTLGGAISGAAVAMRLVRSVIGPIRQLEAAVVNVGGGGDGRAPEGDDELGRLGGAFNAMVAEVRAAQARQTEVARLAALGELSGAVAHELMSPLSAMLADPALQAPELATTRAEAEHARRVVTGLLGFARPGQEPAAEVALDAAAQAAADRYAPLADTRDVTVAVEVEGAAPRVRASASAVRQVLDNLVHNAVVLAPPGSTVTVAVGPGAVVEVRDRGPGIAPAVRARLYEPFVTGRADGTGLGLAVCQRIVRAQGGQLTHADRPGGGTIARWTLAGGTDG